jgi:hypothetical protein
LKFKSGIFLLTVFCILVTGVAVYLLGGINSVQLQASLNRAGIWAPITYIALYTVATILVLPSTPLNLTGGAIFGPWLGTLWTSMAAVIAAVVAFAFTRTVGREAIARKASRAMAIYGCRDASRRIVLYVCYPTVADYPLWLSEFCSGVDLNPISRLPPRNDSRYGSGNLAVRAVRKFWFAGSADWQRPTLDGGVGINGIISWWGNLVSTPSPVSSEGVEEREQQRQHEDVE